MFNQSHNNMNLKFCKYCMNIMDIHSTNDTLKLVCSIPCKQSKLSLESQNIDEPDKKIHDQEQKSVDPVLLSKRIIDNVDTHQSHNMNTIHDPSLLRVFKKCDNCDRNTLFVLHKAHDGKIGNDLICTICRQKK